MIKFNSSLNRSNKNSPRDKKIDYFVFDSKHRLVEFIFAVGGLLNHGIAIASE